MKYSESQSELCLFVQGPVPGHFGVVLPSLIKYDSTFFALVLEDSSDLCTNGDLLLTSICECGVLDQTAAHVILECPLRHVYRRYHGLVKLNAGSTTS